MVFCAFHSVPQLSCITRQVFVPGVNLCNCFSDNTYYFAAKVYCLANKPIVCFPAVIWFTGKWHSDCSRYLHILVLPCECLVSTRVNGYLDIIYLAVQVQQVIFVSC